MIVADTTYFSKTRYRVTKNDGTHYCYFVDNRLHRKDGPALLSMKKSLDFTWYNKGICTRQDGPCFVLAKTKYWSSDSTDKFVEEEEYWNC